MGELTMESAIPFVKLTAHGQVIDLTFTATDVFKDPGSTSEQKLAAKDVRYQIGATSIRQSSGPGNCPASFGSNDDSFLPAQ